MKCPLFSRRIMALDLTPPDGRKRVKVYELRDNDWFDRGTGFCSGHILEVSLSLSWKLYSFERTGIACASPRARLIWDAAPPAHYDNPASTPAPLPERFEPRG